MTGGELLSAKVNLFSHPLRNRGGKANLLKGGHGRKNNGRKIILRTQ